MYILTHQRNFAKLISNTLITRYPIVLCVYSRIPECLSFWHNVGASRAGSPIHGDGKRSQLELFPAGNPPQSANGKFCMGLVSPIVGFDRSINYSISILSLFVHRKQGKKVITILLLVYLLSMYPNLAIYRSLSIYMHVYVMVIHFFLCVLLWNTLFFLIL